VKYGAYATEQGRIEISWTVTDDDQRGQRLRITWHETGGPPVAPPTRTNFGSKLIDINVTHEFEGQIDRDFRPEGLVVTIDIPCTHGIRPIAP
jgi:two-component sensor histidine kinase